MKNLSQCLPLFLSFFKIGAFTFGGGYAMIPLIERETVESHHWVTEEDILDVLAIAESTPGPISINAATFIGHKVAGFWGAACATFGTALPSFLIIAVLSLFIMQYKQIQWLAWMFDGIRAGVVVLVINAVLKLGKKCPKNAFTISIMLLAFVCAALIGLDVILILVLAGAAGIIRQMVLAAKLDGGEQK
ncbi:MAG: chromate transporter [Anaerotruncus sp.]|nr:chromate transporter [Anaerotruncus sp.]